MAMTMLRESSIKRPSNILKSPQGAPRLLLDDLLLLDRHSCDQEVGVDVADSAQQKIRDDAYKEFSTRDLYAIQYHLCPRNEATFGPSC